MSTRGFDSRLKLRHLTLVTAVAEHGSLVRAAEELYISQPVVTRAIQELEEILGVPLFERHPRGMTVTDYGAAFVRHAQSVLAELRSAQTHLEQLGRADLGTVTVGTYLAAAHLLLPLAIDRLKSRHPGLRVVVREDTVGMLRSALAAGGLDLITGRAAQQDDPRFSFHGVYREPMALTVGTGHPLASAAPPELPELLDQPWLLPVAETTLRSEVEQFFTRHGCVLPANVVECNTFLTIRRLLGTGRYLGILPRSLVRDDPALTTLDLPLDEVGWSVGVTVLRGTARTPAADAMLTALIDAGREIADTTAD
ncbi:LysR family transcriptional regulator [Enemella evansiae]|uniref:LysR family transcriptional regulator n=1 Tax=Enemella evansiae TaxID=2016499 RepID=A0A255GQU5_9ACTN|nr:LysR substrate-binding domain-containing protein [Enemella evansiae]OYO16763.1 LysR family transcriptional regulator [Enemella evansiae]